MITSVENLNLHRKMFRIALSILKDENSAADAMQNALLRVIKNENTTIDNLEAFCARAARMAALDILRKRKVRNDVDGDEVLTTCPTTERADSLEETLENVELSERQLTVCRLLASDYKSEDIAVEIGVSLSTVERTLRELREIFS